MQSHVWICLFGGAALRRYDAAGRLDAVVELPVTNPTCPAFGGPGLATPYVTSARHRLTPEQLAAEPLAGAVLALDPGVRGVPRGRSPADVGSPAVTEAAATPVWGDPHAAPRPPALSGDVDVDVCVVGLGGSGLAAVGAALDAGATVAGIDAGPIAGGAAGRNGGFLLAGGAPFLNEAIERWGEERAVGIYRASMAELDRLEAELGGLVRRVGSLRIPGSEDEVADCAAHLQALRRHGLPGERADGPSGPGVFIPGDGSVQPLERCRLLARRALERRARLYCDTPALEIAGDAVTTPAGTVRTKAVVVCVDGWIERVLPELAGEARSTRLQMLATAPVEPGRIPCPVYDNWGYEYWQQLPDGSVAFGGGRGVYGDGEWGLEAEPSEELQDWLERRLRERSGVDAPITHRWAGVIAYTDDRLPVFAEVRPGVIALGAHSGTGNVLGSAGGRAAMAIALGEPAPELARLLRPEHWT